MIRRQLERHGRWLIAIAFLFVLAALSVTYVLIQQRVATPLAHRYVVRAEFEGSAGLEPGLGQPVNVAGVRVGSIAGVEPRDGLALVKMEIDPAHVPHVYANARAALVPNTPIKDLQVEIDPGGPPAPPLPDGGTIEVWGTTSPTDLDEITAALDRDTRDFLEVLVGSADEGSRGRGRDLRAALESLAPTAEQARRITGALAARRRALRRLVHNIALVTKAGASVDRELAQVVERANATVGALASQDEALSESVERLPGTLRAARAVVAEQRFTRELEPTLTALLPPAQRLPGALRAAGPLVERAEPVVRRDLRPLVADVQPLARDLAPTTRDLSRVTPSLKVSFLVLRYLANELGHNPPGDDEGYLFWLAWMAHDLASVLSTEDAHGAVFRGFDVMSCDNLTQQPPLVQLATLATAPVPVC